MVSLPLLKSSLIFLVLLIRRRFSASVKGQILHFPSSAFCWLKQIGCPLFLQRKKIMGLFGIRKDCSSGSATWQALYKQRRRLSRMERKLGSMWETKVHGFSLAELYQPLTGGALARNEEEVFLLPVGFCCVGRVWASPLLVSRHFLTEVSAY